MTAREELLARVRKALSGDAQPGRAAAAAAAEPVVRDYRSAGTMSRAELLDLLAERLVDYKARVRRCDEASLTSTIGAALAGRGAHKLVVPPGLAELSLGILPVVDDGTLSPAALDAMDGVLTNATVAIAETGTIVLDGSPDQGRRAITLVPDYHLCVVRADQVVQTVPEAIARLDPRRPQTWISGPSATSDIELNRVEGVHGPRTLEVILVG
ncbi:MAG: L-lactate dehydrogenase complex protein LldG [Frankiales bacterium]|nr:L-lactate dehydrogenase complex protein LldG [Frankiales bacterium]